MEPDTSHMQSNFWGDARTAPTGSLGGGMHAAAAQLHTEHGIVGMCQFGFGLRLLQASCISLGLQVITLVHDLVALALVLLVGLEVMTGRHPTYKNAPSAPDRT